MLETQQGNWDRAIGLAIVLMLMVFATWNDLTQIVFNAG
jgi:membrane-associated protease RseP (regulator of RpoE activity)